MDINKSLPALLEFLRNNNPEYFGKVGELINAVTGWLTYTVQAFPHYTKHTAEHSEEIIHQISNLLFFEGNPSNPVVTLSAVEAYILIACAYLHDAGMVVSDREKSELLEKNEWKDWISSGVPAKKYKEIQDFQQCGRTIDLDTRNFLANVQLRFLISEFMRQKHHLRSAEIALENQQALGRFAFDDKVLAMTIADICIAHGLNRRDLDDRVKFPEQRDIRREKVNVRFLAIILRLGDLLDMSHERACPLLLNASSHHPLNTRTLNGAQR